MRWAARALSSAPGRASRTRLLEDAGVPFWLWFLRNRAAPDCVAHAPQQRNARLRTGTRIAFSRVE